MNRKASFVQSRILEWYHDNSRDFPWRHTRDLYKIMVAEFMLHRTRAEQVVPVYNEFIKRYPDVHSLAQADPDDIKNVTRHLGLHWRARHFIKAARYIIDKFSGKFPDNYDDLRKIPGVGEYIAGAIFVVCFNKPAPVVDSNIARFINRFYGLNLKGEIRRKKGIVEIATELFNHEEPGKLLFAMVDFTSIICKPGKTDCNFCPLKSQCKFYKGSSPGRQVPGSGASHLCLNPRLARGL